MENNLRNKKEELKNKWEDCFETKIDNVLTTEGIDIFWNDRTPIEIATMILDVATFGCMLDDILSDEPKSKPHKFKIVRKADNVMLDKEFETEQAANDYIIEKVKHSPCTVDDFMVVKVM